MSEWGIQHVKIELANEEGERLIIHQEPGGRVTCQPGHTRGAGKDSAAAPASKAGKDSAAAPASKAGKDPAAAPGSKAGKDPGTTAAKPAEEVKAGARTAPRSTAKPEAAKPERKPARRKASSLQWKPVKDAGYHGFAAKSEGGAFKLLKAKNSQWALFFERPGQKTVPLGCFKEDAPGRVTAQEVHDKGTYRVEPEPITEYRIINVCPADPEAAAPSPEAVDESTPEDIAPNADTDAEMMASLKRALEEV